MAGNLLLQIVRKVPVQKPYVFWAYNYGSYSNIKEWGKVLLVSCAESLSCVLSNVDVSTSNS